MSDEDPREAKTPVDPLTRAKYYFERSQTPVTSKNMTPRELVSDLVACALIEGARPTSMSASAETKFAKQRVLDEIERLIGLRHDCAELERANVGLATESARLRAAIETVLAEDPGIAHHEQAAHCEWARKHLSDALSGASHAPETSGAPVTATQLLEAVAGAVLLIRADICDCERDGEETHRHLCRKFGSPLKASAD